MEPEEKLPKELIDKSLFNGHEYAWKKDDIPLVIKAAFENNLAIIGGQVQFILEDGVCELYWENYDSQEKFASETWKQYVFRSVNECLTQFNEIADEERLVNEGIDKFAFLKEKSVKQKLNLKEHLWFLLYLKSEDDK